MSTLDDKILGEKLHYYCSSDEEDVEREDHEENGSNQQEAIQTRSIKDAMETRSDLRDWEGYSVNTGPKGVIKDWQRYKQIEAEKREARELEKLKLMKKLSMSCRSHLDDEKEKKKENEVDDELKQILKESDSFLDEYMQKRMEEMLMKQQSKQKFGSIEYLESGVHFLDTIEKKHKDVTIVCHIYSRDKKGCEAMNGCLSCLAEKYVFVKFCCIEATAAGMSRHFEKSGVPALLIYKNGNLLGSFVRLTDEFGEDFYSTDVEAYLVEHGFLPDPSLIPEIVKRSTIREGNNDDSDDD
ncbi:phosducin-like protein [Leptotrombidium deliense]|uniref:Phosducin-like protein n=1 Tax=Leptotrombidium deliense TaxID=299467 RepID=A0A443SCP8_9ACAR|nr:phosducin-like protein [Leptotrombidium deliense]